FFKWKIPYLIGVLAAFVFALFMMTQYDRIVMPRVDQGQFMLKVNLPVGTRVEITNSITVGLERYLRRFDVIKSVSTVVGSAKGESSKDEIQRIGSNEGRVLVTLKDERDMSTNELVQKIRTDLATPELRKVVKRANLNFVLYESAFKLGDTESAPVVINFKGANLEALKSLALKTQSRLEEIPGVFDLTNTIPESAPETKIIVDKDKAAFYRISVTDLATAAHISIKGTVASKFKEEGKEIDMRVVLREQDRAAVSELPFILMHSPLGINVPLSEMVTFHSGYGPSEIRRVSQERTIQVLAKVFERPMSEINTDVEKVISELDVPAGYQVELAGESLEVQESFNSLKLAMTLSIVLVYMIMAAQFESYFQPFIIMFTLPLSMIGVAMGLGISHTAISVVVLLGIILLAGIVVNNGIILIDFINIGTSRGLSAYQAAIQSGEVRFRPIMMTALTTILGLVPLAMGLGEGAKLQAPMAITVMGGLLVATFLTLVVIPAIFLGAVRLGGLFRKKPASR
ncbi:MAG: efflux RND transporter permease subunit, partial [Candidatus Omnitrophica bacterium]|nr:efflux RND transporter permease subunit [Candidatus Omnitrophota bacterium]